MTLQEKRAVSAAKHILKSAASNRHFTETECTGYWEEGGKQFVCDGYRCIRLSPAMPILATLSASGTAIGFASGTIDAASHNAFRVNDFIPPRKLLVNYIKTLKTQFPKCYKKHSPAIFVFDVLVNAEYLLDMMDILPDATVTLCNGVRTSPIYFSSDYGDGILCPIRPQKTEAKHNLINPGCNKPFLDIWSN